MSSTQQNAAPFALFAAFTSSPFGGNPAAVVFLDPVKTPLNVLQGLAKNFNQPMVAFVRPPTEESFTDNRVRTTVRYMSHSGDDIALCGHASICAAAAILALPEFQNLSDIKVKLVEFETFLGNRTVPVRVLENGQFELGLPLAPPIKPSADERQRIETFVQHAFRNSGREIKIVDVMVGPQGFEHALLVEIDVEAELADGRC
ncbi:hypothetical protein BKA70DRAFT_726398 [Coprinopsis sp. MPI-PUGE-AT-0042]|nr:hypothetical protein BKA70DRAFT_726398 [Coprinopsis sp. MPI-PUGE-AT-0042]